jgi:hypothetical protein
MFLKRHFPFLNHIARIWFQSFQKSQTGHKVFFSRDIKNEEFYAEIKSAEKFVTFKKKKPRQTKFSNFYSSSSTFLVCNFFVNFLGTV